MPTVAYKPAARTELREAFRWYEEQEPGLGSEFMRSVEATLQLIRRYPKIFPATYKNIRQGVIRRFPYALFYRIEEEKIVVLAVFHVSRNPVIWRERRSE